MAIGVVDIAQFNNEANKLGLASKLGMAVSNDVVDVEIVEIKHGRGLGVNNKTNDERSLIASELISGASLDEVVEEFGISKSSASAYKNGATSTSSYDNPNDELRARNLEVTSNIKGKAQKKLLAAIDAINLVGDIKPNIASAIARDMSTIIRAVEPDGGITVNNNKVIVFKPRMREEDDYEVLEVTE